MLNSHLLIKKQNEADSFKLPTEKVKTNGKKIIFLHALDQNISLVELFLVFESDRNVRAHTSNANQCEKGQSIDSPLMPVHLKINNKKNMEMKEESQEKHRNSTHKALECFKIGKIQWLEKKNHSGEIYCTLGQISCCSLSCFDSPQQETKILGSV